MEKKVKDGLKASMQSIVSENLVGDQQNPLSQTVRRMALTEGQVLHVKHTVDDKGKCTLIPDNVVNPDGSKGNAFFGFNTAEEIVLTTGQIARRGNGMNLQGKTNEEMLLDFCEKVEDEWDKNKANASYKGPAIKVTELRTRPGRNGLQVIPMFSVAW